MEGTTRGEDCHPLACDPAPCPERSYGRQIHRVTRVASPM
jgi:hypothetical protein